MRLRFLALALFTVAPLLAGLNSPASASTLPTGASCHELDFTVPLTAAGPVNQKLAGTLCLPAGTSASTALDILVHGITYTRQYWNWPQDPQEYSFVDKDLAAGRASFFYDLIGHGQSSHPLSLQLTGAAQDAMQLHLIISAMRTRFTTINVIGHSYGSEVASLEASTYNDANRLILTGLLHAEGPSLVELPASVMPAALNPRFASLHLDPGYVTTIPGTRKALFYYDANPLVISYDESTKDVVGVSQIALTAGPLFVPPLVNPSEHITRPVLLLDGDHDGIFCGLALQCTNLNAVTANETPYYKAAASLTVETVPNTGHDLTLHPTADLSFADINNWVDMH